MSFDLFIKECMFILKNFVYIIFVGVMVLFYIFEHNNFGSIDISAYYYSKSDNMYSSLKTVAPEDRIIKASNTLAERLKTEYDKNIYTIYPENFQITASLGEADQQKILNLINNIENTTTIEQMDMYSYELGKILNVKNYEINEDNITGLYARYFVSVMGFPVAMYSIFVIVAYIIRDKKKNINDLAYSKSMESTKIVLSKYLALLTMILTPVVLLSLIPTIDFIILSLRTDLPIDALAFIKYILGWILPTALFVTSFGFFVTFLRNSTIAIFLQCMYTFFWYIMSSPVGEKTGYSLEIALNTDPTTNFSNIGGLLLFKNSINQIIINRSFYTALAILLLVATIRLFDSKRKENVM